MNVFTSHPQLTKSTITLGSFDGVHLGHQYIFDETKILANRYNTESYILTFEPHPRLVLPNNEDFRILTTQDEKLKKMEEFGVQNVIQIPFSMELANMSAVDFAIQYILEPLKPKAIAIGYDHKFGRDRQGSMDVFLNLKSDYNFEIFKLDEFQEHHHKISSSAIRTALSNGEIKLASELLGYNYTIEGIVVEGKKLGRTLGFPTANLQINNSKKLVPKSGVYYTHTHFNGKTYKSATSIGYNPTTDHDHELKIETYILDFDQSIYGQNLTLEFIDFIRDEAKFDSLEALKIAIQSDVDWVKAQ